MVDRPKVTANTVREVLVESGHRCAVCGQPCSLEMAHIVPWRAAKEHTSEDLIALCANCHARADKEGWGERVLRQYKNNPWVVRRASSAGGPTEATRSAEFTIELDASTVEDPKNLELLKNALAAFLDIAPSDVKIKSVKEGGR